MHQCSVFAALLSLYLEWLGTLVETEANRPRFKTMNRNVAKVCVLGTSRYRAAKTNKTTPLWRLLRTQSWRLKNWLMHEFDNALGDLDSLDFLDDQGGDCLAIDLACRVFLI